VNKVKHLHRPIPDGRSADFISFIPLFLKEELGMGTHIGHFSLHHLTQRRATVAE